MRKELRRLKKWQRKNRLKVRAHLRKSQLKAKYNLTLEEYDALVVKQNNLCAICGNVEVSKNRLSVDHNHKTLIVRGLLCTRCNKGLGLFADSQELLNKAINYLKDTDNDTDTAETVLAEVR